MNIKNDWPLILGDASFILSLIIYWNDIFWLRYLTIATIFILILFQSVLITKRDKEEK